VFLSVTRSGGFAGLTRRWSVSAPPHESATWIALVGRCPWEATASDPPPADGADRFTWTIDADLRGRRHRAVIGEDQARGAWRELLDAVRARGSAG